MPLSQPPKPTNTQVAIAIIALLDASRQRESEEAQREAYSAVAAYLAHKVTELG
jgi:hypothetical protein